MIKSYAEIFHELIHPENAERFMGNASFRCMRGFPSYRKDGVIFVSRRNIDKRYIGRENFVAVKEKLPIEYFGENKPSVDTPIQVRLYEQYQNIRYMLHSHTYIMDAPFTKSIIPCGALEEADEIIHLFPDKNMKSFAVNLKGHGSIMLGDTTKKLLNTQYYARPVPEIHKNYFEK